MLEPDWSFSGVGSLFLRAASALGRLRIVRRIGIVLGDSRDDPTIGERLQLSFQSVGYFLGINLLAIHVDGEGFHVPFFLSWVLDRRLRPLVERVVFHPLLFCSCDILSKGVELTPWLGTMLRKNFQRRRECRVRLLATHRFRGGRIAQIESNLVLP